VELQSGEYRVINPSSCLLQVRWDFTDYSGTGKWSREFQAYKNRRPFFTNGEIDTFDTGYPVVSNRHKVLGRGVGFTFRLSTEPGKDCVLIGCSIIVGTNGDA
jgi:hypothetical protein